MRRLKQFQWAAVLAALALPASSALAQEEDTLVISGTFTPALVIGSIETLPDDLVEVVVNANQHRWVLTLHGVSYSYYTDQYEGYDNGYYYSFTEWAKYVHASSFELQFDGPDADILNQVVSSQLVGGAGPDGAILELWHTYGYDASYYPFSSNIYSASWNLGLVPGTWEGYWFGIPGFDSFESDEGGYPVIPEILHSQGTTLSGYQTTGQYFYAGSGSSLVYVGSVAPLPPPPPPPPPPALSILDASVREGNRGTTWLELTVSLSRYPDDVVTVNYQTADGTAKKKSDYTAASGTLLFQPDEISHVISIAIKTDRKREANETFTVKLSNAVGATIDDGVATVSILNDD